MDMDDNNFMNNDQQYPNTVSGQDQQFVDPQQAKQYQQPLYQQPQYQPQPNQFMQQTPEGPSPYYRQTDPATGGSEDPGTRKKKANILCSVSLGLNIIPFVLILILISSGSADIDNRELGNLLADLIVSLIGGSYIASWVLMIIARVKYKESVFAKVLMWVYIGLAILGTIACMALIAMCITTIRDCTTH